MKKVLVVGGSSELGKALINRFRQTWKILNIGFTVNPNAHVNYHLAEDHRLPNGIEKIYEAVENFGPKFDAILCVSGLFGFTSVSKIEHFEQFDIMKKNKIVPFLLGGHIATRYLSPNGMLMFTGSGLALDGSTPETIAYNANSNAIHSMIRSTSEDSSFPKTSCIFGICPKGLNTAEYRKLFPEADHNKWPTPDIIANQVYEWAEGDFRPKSGTFVYVKTENGKIILETKKPLFAGHL